MKYPNQTEATRACPVNSIRSSTVIPFALTRQTKNVLKSEPAIFKKNHGMLVKWRDHQLNVAFSAPQRDLRMRFVRAHSS
jgi:hypothetical protein